MTTADVKVTPGSGANVATFSITEDAETKQIQRVALTDSTGANSPIVRAGSSAVASTDAALVVVARDANANGQTTMANGAPIAIASDQTIINKAVTQSSGITDSRVNAAASTNATSLKASAGNIFSIDVANENTYDVFLKLYDKASAPTVGTDTPVWTIPVYSKTGFSRDFPRGRHFSTGIAYAITKLQADSDTTVVAAGDLTGTIGWI
jgi:hypothetical protein